MLSVIERARRYIAKCPVAISGQGGHNATFHVAAVLVHGFALNECEALRLLGEWNRGCVPPWSETELVHKIQSAAGAQHEESRGHLLGGFVPMSGGGKIGKVARPAKPEFSPMVLKRVAANAASVSDPVEFLRERSPICVDNETSTSVLRHLYPVGCGEKVLIFSDMESQGQLLWHADKGEKIFDQHLPAGPDGVWFLPQPVTGEFSPNPRLGGKLSRRSEEAVTSWRYMVIESDKADRTEWLRCLIQMPLRLVCVCDSAGRSIHALVRLDAASKAEWDGRVKAMKSALVTLGADEYALSAIRLTRLPQAKRENRVQRLLYLNPASDGRPIFDGRKN